MRPQHVGHRDDKPLVGDGGLQLGHSIEGGAQRLLDQQVSAGIEDLGTDIFADAACDFMRRNADRPFFVYLPFNAAHYPNPKNKPQRHGDHGGRDEGNHLG